MVAEHAPSIRRYRVAGTNRPSHVTQSAGQIHRRQIRRAERPVVAQAASPAHADQVVRVACPAWFLPKVVRCSTFMAVRSGESADQVADALDIQAPIADEVRSASFATIPCCPVAGFI